MLLFFGWTIGAFIMGAIGGNRKIGFWGSFLLSLFFSPLIGAIFVATSKPLDEIPNGPRQQSASEAEELKKWFKLYQEGVIDAEEYHRKREKIINR